MFTDLTPRIRNGTIGPNAWPFGSIPFSGPMVSVLSLIWIFWILFRHSLLLMSSHAMDPTLDHANQVKFIHRTSSHPSQQAQHPRNNNYANDVVTQERDTYPKNSAVRCPRYSNGVCATHDTCTLTQKHSTALQPTLHYGHIADWIHLTLLSFQSNNFWFSNWEQCMYCPCSHWGNENFSMVNSQCPLLKELWTPLHHLPTPWGTEISITTPWPWLLISLIWMPGRPCRQDKKTLD